MQFLTHIPGPKRINPTDFGDPLIFPPSSAMMRLTFVDHSKISIAI